MTTVILEIFVVLIFSHLIFSIIYFLWFEEAVNIHCSWNLFKFNFQVLNFRSFFQPQIINNRENFLNYGIPSFPEGKHMKVCFLLLHFGNLNHLSFQPFLTYINPLSIEEQINAHWNLGSSNLLQCCLYYCCHNVQKGHYWELCQPLHQPKRGCHYLELYGSALENNPQRHYFKLAYTSNCHYHSIISLTGIFVSNFSPLSNEIPITPGIVQ